ncbi:alanyl-tRNA editing protein [Rubrobacter aplysinae]|uniref:alanyl-tRNA editing protein n=1 Tax=Rubrobacter aplysinae TaxID=909625 RepID=UPI000A0106AB|nr:alanyl-tRNA editing protein [Rubrobacter aplysinae]
MRGEKEEAGTRELFLEDAYLREFDARVLRIAGREVWLERTAFCPGGAGQPHDKGSLGVGPIEARVVDVQRRDGEIVHVTDNPIPETVGRLVGVLDWERRYSHMRYHTALHVLCAVLGRDFGVEVTGGKIYADRARVDFSPPEDRGEWTPEIADEIERAANRELAKESPVSVHEPPPDTEEPAHESFASDRPDPVRVVEIPGTDARLDAGLHVANTEEVGRIRITHHKNRNNRKSFGSKVRATGTGERVEFVLEDL